MPKTRNKNCNALEVDSATGGSNSNNTANLLLALNSKTINADDTTTNKKTSDDNTNTNTNTDNPTNISGTVAVPTEVVVGAVIDNMINNLNNNKTVSVPVSSNNL